MEKEKNKNSFLITCGSCIAILLVMCYFGISSSVKGTYSAKTCSCPNGGTLVGTKCVKSCAGLDQTSCMAHVDDDKDDLNECKWDGIANCSGTYDEYNATCTENNPSTTKPETKSCYKCGTDYIWGIDSVYENNAGCTLQPGKIQETCKAPTPPTYRCYKCGLADGTFKYTWSPTAVSGCSVVDKTESECKNEYACYKCSGDSYHWYPKSIGDSSVGCEIQPGKSENTCKATPSSGAKNFKVTFNRAEGNELFATCWTVNGKLSGCSYDYASVCGKWSTNNMYGDQSNGISSGAIASHEFTGNTNLYCVAGTSIHPSGPTNPTTKPSNPTTKPSNPTTNPSNPTTKPSTTKPTVPSSSSNIEENPKTGQIAIFIVWVIALSTIVYSVWYFQKLRED